MAVARINFLDVPLDILPYEDIEATVLDLISRPGVQYIMFLSFRDILRARRRGTFRNVVLNAALCLPTSKSIVKGARFLRLPQPVRHQPFALIIKMLNTIDAHFKSLYLLGGHQKSLLIAERNVRSTFPNIHLLGRFPGYYHRDMEKNVLSAMTKAAPSLTILSNGIPKGLQWIYQHQTHFKSGIFVYHRHIIDIFSAQKKRVSEKTFARGNEYIVEALKNPLKLLSFFSYIRYKCLLLFFRLFKNKD